MANPYAVLAGPPATPAPSAPPPPSTGSNPYSVLSGMSSAPPPENPILSAGKQVVTGVGNALDAQRWAAAKLLTGKSDTGEQRTAERQAVGTQGIYDALGHVPVVGHFLQGTSDVIQDTLTDPLTYETAGAGPLLKATGLAAKAAPAVEAAGKAIQSTPIGQVLYDTLHWGGEVSRTHGASTTNKVRGALNKASTVGNQTETEYKRISQGIINSLTPEERTNVRKSLNGELVPKETPSLHHQTTPGTALNMFTLGSKSPMTWVSPYEDLALGQGLGDQAARVTIDRNAVPKISTPNPQKPSAGIIKAQRGDYPEYTIDQDIPKEAVKSVFIPDAFIQRSSSGVINTWDNWRNVIKQAVPGATEEKVDGGVLFKRPTATVLTPKEQQAAKSLRALTERDYAERKQAMTARTFNTMARNLPAADRAALYQALKTGQRPEGILGQHFDEIQHEVDVAMPKRQNYAPTVHPQDAEEGAGRKAQSFKEGEGLDTRNLPRPDVPTDPSNPNQLGEGFDAMAKNAGRQASNKVIHEELGNLFHDPTIEKLITQTTKATGNERTATEKVRDAWLGMIGYPRAAVVSLTPRHAANIMDLAANTVPPQEFPGFVKNVTTLVPKLVRAQMKGDDETFAELTKDGRDLGAINADFAEHKAFFQNVPGLKNWTKFNNSLTWAVDTAAKQEYAKIIKRQMPDLEDRKPIYRAQSTPGNPEVSKDRNATFFARDKEMVEPLTEALGNTGGSHLVERTESAKNPLNIEAVPGNLLHGVADKLHPNLKIPQNADKIGPEILRPILTKLGVEPQEVERLLSLPDKNLTAQERAAVEMARKAGHDAIVSDDEYVSLHPDAHMPQVSEQDRSLQKLEAGGLAASRLVDYAHVSPLVKALRYVAPFGTFRGSVPGAVLGGIARNPARAAFVNRATGGTAYGNKPAPKQHGVELYNPTADIGRATDLQGVADYVRGSLGAPAQAALTLASEAATGNAGASLQDTLKELQAIPGQIQRGQWQQIGKQPKESPYAKAVALRAARYMNYQNPVDLRWLWSAASAGIPEAQAVIEQLGLGQFKARDAGKELLQQSTGIGVK